MGRSDGCCDVDVASLPCEAARAGTPVGSASSSARSEAHGPSRYPSRAYTRSFTRRTRPARAPSVRCRPEGFKLDEGFQDIFPPAPNSMHDDSDAVSADAPASQGGLFFGVSVWAICQDIGHRAGHLGHPPDCSPRSLDFGRAERMESIETQAPPVPCLHSDRVSRRSSAVRWNAKERRDDRSQQRALAEVRFTRAFPRPIRRVRRRERASARSANVSIIAIILFYCPAVHPPSMRRGPSSTSLRRSERCDVHRHQSLTSIVLSSAASAPCWTRRA